MSHIHPDISLGFTEKKFPAGSHICQIFSDDEERQDSLMKYILSGLAGGEKTCCFSENVTDSLLDQFLAPHGVSLKAAKDSGAFALSGTKDVYFKDGRFDPDRILKVLAAYYEESVRQGYSSARVIGEMSPEVQHVPGGSRLFEYESKVSLLQRQSPVTTVCQYDARSFDGAMIMDVLKVHPLMIVKGTVVHNPFFIPPEKFLTAS